MYVKTVLTFGEKPSPAKAKIALRKTVQESQATNPDVAKVLTNNFYMDDICDSVDTVEEAQRLSKDIDSVLKEGGFSFKGWISNKDLINTDRQKISDVTEVFEGEDDDKVLGVVWNPRTDELLFKVNADSFKTLDLTDQGQVMLTKQVIHRGYHMSACGYECYL